ACCRTRRRYRPLATAAAATRWPRRCGRVRASGSSRTSKVGHSPRSTGATRRGTASPSRDLVPRSRRIERRRAGSPATRSPPARPPLAAAPRPVGCRQEALRPTPLDDAVDVHGLVPQIAVRPPCFDLLPREALYRLPVALVARRDVSCGPFGVEAIGVTR